MSKMEYENLYSLGNEWHANVWIKADNDAGKKLIETVNTNLNLFAPDKVKVRTGFQKYDTYVRTRGSAGGTYAAICGWAARQDDGGVSAANDVWDFFETKALNDLSPTLMELVVIVCFAEVARGYRGESFLAFGRWILAIRTATSPGAAKALWLAYNEFWPPSLTYAADMKLDYDSV
ncbi:MAG TPA: hypothetical protein VGN16_23065 [Acidobacteriaceae bacterium]|jgi:hypothetical protein